jgi:hypothetical protein
VLAGPVVPGARVAPPLFVETGGACDGMRVTASGGSATGGGTVPVSRTTAAVA